MTELQWKIEDGQLQVFEDGEWLFAYPKDAAEVVLAAILATQEKCAQVAQNYGHGEFVSTMRSKTAYDIASAIRALKMETGHG